MSSCSKQVDKSPTNTKLCADLAQAMHKAADADGRDLPVNSNPLQSAGHDVHRKQEELTAAII